MPVVVGYWKIRGLAQPIRLLLTYAGVEFEEKYYHCGPAPDFSKDDWFKEKYSMGLTFPNLPYIIDGEVKLSQSNTILRYLARKHGLEGKTEAEVIRADLLQEQLNDVYRSWIMWCYGMDTTTNYADSLPDKLKEFEKFLGNSQWFAGDTLTYADFTMYEYLAKQKIWKSDVFQHCPKLAAYVDRFEALPAIHKYMNSARFLKWPLNNPRAQYGGSIDPE